MTNFIRLRNFTFSLIAIALGGGLVFADPSAPNPQPKPVIHKILTGGTQHLDIGQRDLIPSFRADLNPSFYLRTRDIPTPDKFKITHTLSGTATRQIAIASSKNQPEIHIALVNALFNWPVTSAYSEQNPSEWCSIIFMKPQMVDYNLAAWDGNSMTDPSPNGGGAFVEIYNTSGTPGSFYLVECSVEAEPLSPPNNQFKVSVEGSGTQLIPVPGRGQQLQFVVQLGKSGAGTACAMIQYPGVWNISSCQITPLGS
jgi:hypothetical protein